MESARAAMEPTRQEVKGGGAAATVPKRGRPSQGKQRIEIFFIENKEHRQVTFSKRRTGLFKKASELCLLCGAHVAVVVFSPAGRPKAFGIGDPSVDDVRQAEETKARVAAEQARMDAIGEKVMQAAGRRFWWEADVEQLGEAELPEFAKALQHLRDNAQRLVEQLSTAAPPPPPPLPLPLQ